MAADSTHPLVRLETLALIAVGGFAGSNLRYFATGLLADIPAVVLVNALGSFALGALTYEAEYAGLIGRKSRLVFATGFLSSLTTYSTFAIQTAVTAGPGEPLVLLAVVVGNYGLGITGVLASRALVRRYLAEPRPTGGETA